MANVLGFGAMGDGVADDTAALQHALASGDGVLRLNKGTYRLTKPLEIDLGRTGFSGVRGESGASRLVMCGPGPALRIVGNHQGTAAPASYRPETWEKERFPVLADFEIVGEHPEADGIELVRTTKCVVSRVLVRRCGVGIRLSERNRDVVIADSHLYDNRQVGLLFDRCNLHQIIVHGCHISWNKEAGIKSIGGDVHNLQIVGNDIEYNNITAGGTRMLPSAEELAAHAGGSEILFDATDGVVSEVTISGNTIQATVQERGANIRIIGAEVPRPQFSDVTHAGDTAHLIAITGNILGSQSRAIDLRNVSRITVTGNTIYDSAELSILAVRSSAVVVSGNTLSWRGRDSETPRDGLRFEDCEGVVLSGLSAQRLGAGTAEKGAGVTLVRCVDSSLSDSLLLDSLHRGVELDECRRCRVTNNTIADRRVQPVMREAIRIRGGSGNLIAGNLLAGATVAAVVSDGPHVVRDNQPDAP